MFTSEGDVDFEAFLLVKELETCLLADTLTICFVYRLELISAFLALGSLA